MLRRDFLHGLGTLAAVRLLGAKPAATGLIQTVAGSVAAEDLGFTLPHEHVLVDFIGAGQVSPARYDVDEVVASARPHLEQARRLGVRTIFECTPAYLARDVALLRRLGAATGLNLVTNTGLYGARQNRFLPAYAQTETARQLADRWIAEARDGIDGTGIRPGFIKCGVDPEPRLSEIHRKLVQAAALTHLETGLTIAVHTGRGPGLEQLDVLAAQGVAAEAFVWVHAQGATDDALFAAADRGAWLSCDGLAPPSVTRHLHLCRELKRRGHLGQLLLSHDAGWYDPGKPGGGVFRGYDLLFTTFLPALREAGFDDGELRQMTVGNPARAFAIRTRRM